MRLTLRTLLAHMDDVLDPADAKDVGEKIESSEFAANLVRRIRGVTADARLSAPRLHGKAAGLDSNTVAEYLNDVLPAERVEDFERYCLESDVHLSEVASCHQILALALSEPAEVTDAARQRMHGLLAAYETGRVGKSAAKAADAGQVADGDGKPAPTSAESAQPAAAKHHAARRHAVEVPEYLKETKSSVRFWQAAAVVLLAALLGLAMIMAFGGFGIFNRDADPAVAEKPSGDPAEEGENEQESDDATDDDAADGDAADGDPLANTSNATDPDASVPDGDAGDDESPVPVNPPDGTSTPDSNSTQAEPGDPTQALPSDPAVPVMPPAGGPEDTTEDKTGENSAEAAEPVESDLPPVDPAADVPEATSDPEGPAKVLPKLPMPGEKTAVGKYTLPGSVLFRRAADDGEWSRMPALGSLFGGDRLITPPTSRSQVTLDGGVVLDMLGDTEVELIAPEAPGAAPIVNIAYGRVIVADAREPVVMQAGDQAFEISFNDAASGAAVEVRPVRAPGTNPVDVPSQLQVDVFAFKGTTMLQHAGDAQPAVLQAPARRTLGLDAPAGEAALPEWIRKQDLTSAERLAHAAMEENLRGDAGSMLVGGLLELADDRPRKRSEVRTLACRALMSIGRFDATIAALGNSEFRAAWPVLIDSLKRHIARDVNSAAAVREAFTMRYGEIRAAELFRMLWGYSDEDLTGGEAEKLVSCLDHADLEFRVLGSWNLRDVTGVGNVFYRPDSPPVQRKQYVRQWQQRLESGQIVNETVE